MPATLGSGPRGITLPEAPGEKPPVDLIELFGTAK
jgi:hypothetical protein